MYAFHGFLVNYISAFLVNYVSAFLLYSLFWECSIKRTKGSLSERLIQGRKNTLSKTNKRKKRNKVKAVEEYRHHTDMYNELYIYKFKSAICPFFLESPRGLETYENS